jgi:hypothetical protein
MLPLVAQSVKRYFCFRVAASSNNRINTVGFHFRYKPSQLCVRNKENKMSDPIHIF